MGQTQLPSPDNGGAPGAPAPSRVRTENSPAATPQAIARERRSHSRTTWHATVHVTFEIQAGREPVRTRAQVQTRDISRGGFCFLYNRYVSAGTRVTAELRTGGQLVTIQGTVRSCWLDSGTTHCVGVQFDQVHR